MNVLRFNPVSGAVRRLTRRETGSRQRTDGRQRRRTAQRRSGIADRRRLQTDYPNCRRKQVADRRRMNGDRRYAYSRHHDTHTVRPTFPNRGEIRKGQLIDIAV